MWMTTLGAPLVCNLSRYAWPRFIWVIVDSIIPSSQYKGTETIIKALIYCNLSTKSQDTSYKDGLLDCWSEKRSQLESSSSLERSLFPLQYIGWLARQINCAAIYRYKPCILSNVLQVGGRDVVGAERHGSSSFVVVYCPGRLKSKRLHRWAVMNSQNWCLLAL